jgi:hypothetical protein
MTAFVLITGVLFKPAERRTSKAGKVFVVATVKAAAVDPLNNEFWNVLCFSESAQAEMLRLEAGEKLSIQGGLKLETFRRDDGEIRISKTVFCDCVLPLRAPPKERKAKVKPAEQQTLRPVNIIPATTSPDLDDEIPF